MFRGILILLSIWMSPIALSQSAFVLVHGGYFIPQGTLERNHQSAPQYGAEVGFNLGDFDDFQYGFAAGYSESVQKLNFNLNAAEDNQSTMSHIYGVGRIAREYYGFDGFAMAGIGLLNETAPIEPGHDSIKNEPTQIVSMGVRFPLTEPLFIGLRCDLIFHEENSERTQSIAPGLFFEASFD